MREIKFRAVRISDRKVFDGLTIYDFDSGFCIPAETMEIDLYLHTGLKDKNGKEIYEGDIVSVMKNGHPIQPFPVSFYRGAFGIGNFTPFSITNIKGFEVIGNIYENKELLDA